MKKTFIFIIIVFLIFTSCLKSPKNPDLQNTSSNTPPTKPYSPFPENNATNIPIEIELKWKSEDKDGDKLTYEIYFGTDQNPKKINESDKNSYKVSNLSFKTKYYWKIVAKDGKGGVAESSVWNFTTLDNTLPEKPSNPNPKNNATNVSTSPKISWECSDKDGDKLTYDLFIGENKDLSEPIITNLEKNEYTISNLKSLTTYYWKVIAKDGKGGISQSDIWSFTTLNNVPIILEKSTPTNNEINVSNLPKISWEAYDPDGDTLTYDIYFGKEKNPPLFKSDHNENYFFPGYLKINTKYYWKIIAKDKNGETTSSPIWNFTTTDLPNSPTPNDGEVGVKTNNLSFNWLYIIDETNPDCTKHPEIKFTIYISTEPDPKNHINVWYQNDIVGSYFILNTPLNLNTTYYWQVDVYNQNNGITKSSPVWRFVTRGNSNPSVSYISPLNGETNISTETVTLKWQGYDPDNDYYLLYDVYFGTNENNLTKHNWAPLGKTNYNISNLNGDTKYFWKIIVKDEYGGYGEGPIWNFYTSNNPPSIPVIISPTNNQQNVENPVRFEWSSTDPDGKPLTYDFYLNTSNSFSSPYLKNLSNNYLEENLKGHTTYYWKVSASDGKDTTESPVFLFTTKNNIPSINILSPQDGETNVSLDTVLNWEAQDYDNDNLKYDIYFGQTTNPALIESNYTSNTYTPKLFYSQTYYWKVTVKDDYGGITTSEIRSFKTKDPENNISNILNEFNMGNFVDGVKVSDGYVFLGQVYGSNFEEGYLIYKIDFNGNFLWQTTNFGKKYYVNKILELHDSYIVIGSVGGSNPSPVVLKIDKSNGSIIWEKNYAPENLEQNDNNFFSCADSLDGIVIVGSTSNLQTSNDNREDLWALKIDYDGNIIWNNTFSNGGYEKAYDVYIDQDFSEIFIVGYTSTNDNDMDINDETFDVWIIKLDQFGNKISERSFGTLSKNDYGISIILDENKNVIIAGDSYYNGTYDLLLLKLDNSLNNIEISKYIDIDNDDHLINLSKSILGYYALGLNTSIIDSNYSNEKSKFMLLNEEFETLYINDTNIKNPYILFGENNSFVIIGASYDTIEKPLYEIYK